MAFQGCDFCVDCSSDGDGDDAVVVADVGSFVEVVIVDCGSLWWRGELKVRSVDHVVVGMKVR